MASLHQELEAIRSNFSGLDILVGGQAFRWGGVEQLKKYPKTEYVPSLAALEKLIA